MISQLYLGINHHITRNIKIKLKNQNSYGMYSETQNSFQEQDLITNMEEKDKINQLIIQNQQTYQKLKNENLSKLNYKTSNNNKKLHINKKKEQQTQSLKNLPKTIQIQILKSIEPQSQRINLEHSQQNDLFLNKTLTNNPDKTIIYNEMTQLIGNQMGFLDIFLSCSTHKKLVLFIFQFNSGKITYKHHLSINQLYETFPLYYEQVLNKEFFKSLLFYFVIQDEKLFPLCEEFNKQSKLFIEQNLIQIHRYNQDKSILEVSEVDSDYSSINKSPKYKDQQKKQFSNISSDKKQKQTQKQKLELNENYQNKSQSQQLKSYQQENYYSNDNKLIQSQQLINISHSYEQSIDLVNSNENIIKYDQSLNNNNKYQEKSDQIEQERINDILSQNCDIDSITEKNSILEIKQESKIQSADLSFEDKDCLIVNEENQQQQNRYESEQSIQKENIILPKDQKISENEQHYNKNSDNNDNPTSINKNNLDLQVQDIDQNQRIQKKNVSYLQSNEKLITKIKQKHHDSKGNDIIEEKIMNGEKEYIQNFIEQNGLQLQRSIQVIQDRYRYKKMQQSQQKIQEQQYFSFSGGYLEKKSDFCLQEQIQISQFSNDYQNENCFSNNLELKNFTNQNKNIENKFIHNLNDFNIEVKYMQKDINLQDQQIIESYKNLHIINKDNKKSNLKSSQNDLKKMINQKYEECNRNIQLLQDRFRFKQMIKQKIYNDDDLLDSKSMKQSILIQKDKINQNKKKQKRVQFMPQDIQQDQMQKSSKNKNYNHLQTRSIQIQSTIEDPPEKTQLKDYAHYSNQQLFDQKKIKKCF